MLTDESYNEKELLIQVAGGDEVAFSKLFHHYRNKIYGSAYKLSRSTVVAEEVVQNIFLKIWLRKEKLTSIQNFNAYLFVVTRNEIYLALSRIARDTMVKSLLSENHTEGENDNEKQLIYREYQDILQKAIARLPMQQKKVYQLIKVEGMKREEAAELLRIHPETIKTHLARAVKSVRNYCTLHLPLLSGLVFLLSLWYLKK